MSSSTVKAQQLANEANVYSTIETNKTNKEIADAANELNYKMFTEQNVWNREQWQLENEYNSPSKQMERYLQAGINPLWAMSDSDPGNAAHLESADAPSAEVATMQAPHVEPEYDRYLGSKLSAITGALDSVLNYSEGFAKLALDAEDVATRKSQAASTAGLQTAQAAYVRSQTVGQELFNGLTSDTYFNQVRGKQLQVDQIQSEINKNEADTEFVKARKSTEDEIKNQVIAQTDYINQQRQSLIQETQQGWRQVEIAQQNANIAQQNADTSEYAAKSHSYYEGENLNLKNKEFTLNREKTIAELNQKSISQIMDFYNSQRNKLEQWAGASGMKIQSMFDPLGESKQGQITQVLENMALCGDALAKKVKDEPWNYEAVKSFDEWQKSVDSLPAGPLSSGYISPIDVPQSNPIHGFEVLNPDDF